MKSKARTFLIDYLDDLLVAIGSLVLTTAGFFICTWVGLAVLGTAFIVFGYLVGKGGLNDNTKRNRKS